MVRRREARAGLGGVVTLDRVRLVWTLWASTPHARGEPSTTLAAENALDEIGTILSNEDPAPAKLATCGLLLKCRHVKAQHAPTSVVSVAVTEGGPVQPRTFALCKTCTLHAYAVLMDLSE